MFILQLIQVAATTATVVCVPAAPLPAPRLAGGGFGVRAFGDPLVERSLDAGGLGVGLLDFNRRARPPSASRPARRHPGL
jgi:hypothetical protein